MAGGNFASFLHNFVLPSGIPVLTSKGTVPERQKRENNNLVINWLGITAYR